MSFINVSTKLLSCIALTFLCSCSDEKIPGQSATVASTNLSKEYSELAARAKRFNSDPEHMNHWWLNGEHCFGSELGEEANTLYPDGTEQFPDRLRWRVMDFVEKPGAVDFLFNHLLQNRADDSAVLVDAEMLIFFSEIGPYAHDASFFLPSRNSASIMRALQAGYFAKADSRYPFAHIKEIIEVSAQKCKPL